MTSGPGPGSVLTGFPGPQVTFLDSQRDPANSTLPFPGRERPGELVFLSPAGWERAPHQEEGGRRIRPLDCLFAFRQEVYLEPAGRASREVYLRSQPRPPGWPGWRWGVAPSVATAGNGHRTLREKLGSEGPAPGPSAGTAHSAGRWAHFPERPASLPGSAERPCGAPLQADVQASAGQWHQRGPAWLVARKSRGSSRAHAGCPGVPLGHFLGSEGRVPAVQPHAYTPAPEEPSVPPGSQPPPG